MTNFKEICEHPLDNNWHLRECHCGFWHMKFRADGYGGFASLDGFPIEVLLFQESDNGERNQSS